LGLRISNPALVSLVQLSRADFLRLTHDLIQMALMRPERVDVPIMDLLASVSAHVLNVIDTQLLVAELRRFTNPTPKQRDRVAGVASSNIGGVVHDVLFDHTRSKRVIDPPPEDIAQFGVAVLIQHHLRRPAKPRDDSGVEIGEEVIFGHGDENQRYIGEIM
jgi:hypothetical protein